MHTLVDYFNRGGSVMWLLLIIAIFGLAIIIERIITLVRFIGLRKKPLEVAKKVVEILGEENGLEKAKEYLAGEKSPIASIFLAGLEKIKMGRVAVEEAMSAEAVASLAFLDRGMLFFPAIATVAPILGFLGTVTGMIKAFSAIAMAGEVEPTLVAAGISEALITTATGLFIAAPVAIAEAIFRWVINNYRNAIEEATNLLLEELREKGLLKD